MKHSNSYINTNPFPTIVMGEITRKGINSNDKNTRVYYIRAASQAFLNQTDAKKIILKKYGNKCNICGSKENLQIDHIISISDVAKGFMIFEDLNKEDNLQVLCKKCNMKKHHDKVRSRKREALESYESNTK